MAADPLDLLSYFPLPVRFVVDDTELRSVCDHCVLPELTSIIVEYAHEYKLGDLYLSMLSEFANVPLFEHYKLLKDTKERIVEPYKPQLVLVAQVESPEPLTAKTGRLHLLITIELQAYWIICGYSATEYLAGELNKLYGYKCPHNGCEGKPKQQK